MDIKLKRKYLRKARIVLRRREQDRTAKLRVTDDTVTNSLYEDPIEDVSIHIETNKELKRLLLASVGSDLHQHIDSLISDKSRLQYDLDKSESQLGVATEEVDHLLIECDVWRSKFLASRVMIEDLVRLREHMVATYSGCVRSLSVMMDERQTLRRDVAMCNDMLYQCLVQVNKADGLFVNRQATKDIIDVASINHKASHQLLTLLSEGRKCPTDDKWDETGCSFNDSQGEYLANQALTAASSKPTLHSSTQYSLPHLSVGEQHLLQRTSTEGRYPRHHTGSTTDRIILNIPNTPSLSMLHYCRKCTGRVLNV